MISKAEYIQLHTNFVTADGTILHKPANVQKKKKKVILCVAVKVGIFCLEQINMR